MLYYFEKIKILKIYKNIDLFKKSVFGTDHDLLRISEISDSDLKYWSMKKIVTNLNFKVFNHFSVSRIFVI